MDFSHIASFGKSPGQAGLPRRVSRPGADVACAIALQMISCRALSCPEANHHSGETVTRS